MKVQQPNATENFSKSLSASVLNESWKRKTEYRS